MTQGQVFSSSAVIQINSAHHICALRSMWFLSYRRSSYDSSSCTLWFGSQKWVIALAAGRSRVSRALGGLMSDFGLQNDDEKHNFTQYLQVQYLRN